MTPELSTLLAVLAGGMVLVAAGVYWWINRTPSIRRDENDTLPLFGGLLPGERATPPAGAPPVREGALPEESRPFSAPLASPPAAPAASAPPSMPATTPRAAPQAAPRSTPAATPVSSAAVAPAPPPVEPPLSKPVIREFVTSGPPPAARATPSRTTPVAPVAAQTNGAEHAVRNADGVPGTMVEGHALRFSVPAEGTLQFLPGRLEIASGLDAGREIRFVRVDGQNGHEVTFGRSEGELYRHIQLRDKTVSRAHARMVYRASHWHLQNLSQTNPVAYNGRELPSGAEQQLADGDRVEMGEVQFTFRGR